MTSKDLERSTHAADMSIEPEAPGHTGTLIVATLIASLGSFNFGLNLSVVNSTATTFSSCSPSEDNTWKCFHVPFEYWGYVAGMMCVGALVGSIIGGKFIDQQGRNKMIMWSAASYSLGAVILAAAINYAMLLAGRFFVGMGVGIGCIGIPLYLTEIAPLASRGLFGSAHQMAIVVGYLVGELLGYAGMFKPLYWRLFFATPLLPSLIQLGGVPWLCPKSPRVSATNGNEAEAKESLKRLRGVDYREGEYDDLNVSVQASRAASAQSWGLKELLFTHRSRAWKSMTVATTLHVGQQFSGINSVFFFSKAIFASQDAIPAAIVPVLIAILNLTMTLLAIILIDRAGRRLLAFLSSSVMLIASVTLIIAFHGNFTMIALVAVLTYVASFAFGMGPVPWLMTNELFPTYAAGAAVSFAVAANWLCNTIVTFAFPPCWQLYGPWAFIPYSVAIALFVVFTILVLPETKGRPFDFI